MTSRTEATWEELYHVPDNTKAEIVGGEIVVMSPTGFAPNRASSKIWLSLYQHEQRVGNGLAVADNAGFKVDLPQRKSFSPDAAWYIGEHSNMKFFEGAPVFAAEVRSENDYGRQAERDIAAKRADYFAAGALVVWDVDLLADDVVRVYRSNSPDVPVLFRRGEIANAEPAVPGWTMFVDELFA